MESHGWWLVTVCNDWLMIRRNIWLKRLNGCDSPPYETLVISRHRWVPVLSQNGGPKPSQSYDNFGTGQVPRHLGKQSHLTYDQPHVRHAADVLAAENLKNGLFTDPTFCPDIQRLILPMVHYHLYYPRLVVLISTTKGLVLPASTPAAEHWETLGRTSSRPKRRSSGLLTRREQEQ